MAMMDPYIYRMSLMAMQAFQLHEDIKELLQHYHDDMLEREAPEVVDAKTEPVVTGIIGGHHQEPFSGGSLQPERDIDGDRVPRLPTLPSSGRCSTYGTALGAD